MSDYDKMEAGEELNALIATQVMGWVDGEAPRGYRDDWRTPEGKLLDKEDECQFSTDIATAWQVIEKMQAGGCEWTMTGHPDGWVEVSFYHLKRGLFGRYTALMPLATCLATLKCLASKERPRE